MIQLVVITFTPIRIMGRRSFFNPSSSALCSGSPDIGLSWCIWVSIKKGVHVPSLRQLGKIEFLQKRSCFFMSCASI